MAKLATDDKLKFDWKPMRGELCRIIADTVSKMFETVKQERYKVEQTV